MANITRYIPNTFTCFNLFFGCVASATALQGHYQWAFLFIIISALFDFLDGMMARLLHAYSDIGKDLDSLSDVVSFGVAPSLMVFSLLGSITYPDYLQPVSRLLPYFAFVIAVFSALRLAKFNNDPRQSHSFIGLPVPAHALFWASLVSTSAGHLDGIIAHNPLSVYLPFLLIFLMSWMLVSRLPMFSLKFENLSWADNNVRYLFLAVSLVLLILFREIGVAAVILWYIILSVLQQFITCRR
ncbi:MAG: CDP-diacylglycerol--serine O-phosphatidyltransferase [Prevotellaceae bacterium]|jgi:CDP-diacylglycerol--serine O-phosphatidyltransferase|nr:CDP-diacylglycerol--serine O-phosphatidyltransferase [Prevotellaceae bacterium]